MLGQLRSDNISLPDQDHAHAQFLGGADRTFYFAFWGVIAPHGIDRYGQHEGVRTLLLNDFDDFPALVLPTLRANAMRKFRLVAIRAFGKNGPG